MNTPTLTPLEHALVSALVSALVRELHGSRTSETTVLGAGIARNDAAGTRHEEPRRTGDAAVIEHP